MEFEKNSDGVKLSVSDGFAKIVVSGVAAGISGLCLVFGM